MSLHAEHAVVYMIDVFERILIVAYNGNVPEKTVYDILDQRYGEWNNVEDYPETENYCCEEWMLIGLEELGIVYTPIYIGEED